MYHLLLVFNHLENERKEILLVKRQLMKCVLNKLAVRVTISKIITLNITKVAFTISQIVPCFDLLVSVSRTFFAVHFS